MSQTFAKRHAGLSVGGLACAVALIVGLGCPAVSTAGTTYFNAQFVCNDRGAVYPLANARVELRKRGADWLPKWLTDDLIDAHTADDEGRVRMGVTYEDEDDFYLRVQLSHDGVRATEWYAPWAWFADTPTHYSNRLEQQFGTLGLGDGRVSPECSAYEGVRRAYQAYRGEIGQRPPSGGLTISVNAPVPSGVPVAPFTSIFWPPRYVPGTRAGEFENASHEFAHTVRHGLDGDVAHFAADVLNFEYPQHHSACKRTNPGFAFNEGWAEYWSGDFGPAPNCPNVSRTDYSVEGNVAAALTALDVECPGIDRKQMVEVLARNPGQIHSFDEFRRALGCIRPLTPPKALRAQSAPPISRRLQIEVAKAQAKALKSTIAGLATELRVATKEAARGALACRPKPCLPALKRAIRPSLIAAELGQARLLRKTLSFQTSSRGLKTLGRPPSSQFQRRLQTRARVFRRALAKLEARALADALKAAAPMLRNDHSPAVKEIGRDLRAALRTFRAGRLPTGFAIPTPGSGALLKARPPLLSPIPRPLVPPPVSPPPLAPQPVPPPAPVLAPAPAPDLVIDRIYALFNVDRSAFEVKIDVRNSGTAGAPASMTGLTLAGAPEVLIDTPALAPGQSSTVTSACPSGTQSATARTDATGLVAESNETNNSRAADQPFCVFGDA